MFDKSRIMKEAHKRTRQDMANFPKLYAGYSYAAVFALCLRGAWRDAKAGKFDATANLRREGLRGEVLRLQMKTRLFAPDYARWSALSAELAAMGA
ncbi:hypothetical protein Q669_00495 [Labrenzia sp. C1B10]|uniref:hypothetical protein n=1 Tax=unclassified Labrenzia TaxID=2648686 RepID=UPI0003B8B03D|nr:MULTISPECIES: hypothetical protein [unclassified Labrenzia]ERP98769.1 hypothetical protein Q669_00495 [Labrenzia sp. C1B10]ERS00961.1 hypothetical protein Q675_09145 [Labrenzia sp. C1B70]